MKRSFSAIICAQWTTVPPVATADLTGQTVIVVGANVGLGFESAKHFAKMNPARLILACRSEEKGKAAVEKIREETGYTPELELLDLAKFSSVIAFVDRFLKNKDARLDILMANAAVAIYEHKETSDGWEESYVHEYPEIELRMKPELSSFFFFAQRIQVNNLSTSLLCLLLAPRMVETGEKLKTKPRLVVVGSEVHYWSTFKNEVFESKSAFRTISSKEYGKMDARYYDTKLLNLFFTRSLADLLADTPVIADCVNPGYCYSALRRKFQGIRQAADWVMEKALARTSEEGGRQLTYAAVGSPEDPDRLRGQYISLHCVEEPSDYVLGSEGKKRQDVLWNDLIAVLSEVDPRVREIVENFSH
ncbi:hypothetical protein EST38_g789 [Candolleomyces aberdarensis]|uniref:Uncharacterized protein n=1 Tax=Candolleomyces aberdarensis TaxID=2316362 RepID=A0A4Q2E101_9AGAR|nr:hypothetical protein EST38_g789 [Candolleomyces aberdarensis]